MFIDKMLNQTNAPLLEQMVKFTETRHRVLAENIVNASTPGYIQKDVSLPGFQQMLQERVAKRAESAPGTVSFDDINAEIENPRRGILFHDGNNRSMEQLMSDQAKNALLHNMVVELLKKQYSAMENALRERVT